VKEQRSPNTAISGSPPNGSCIWSTSHSKLIAGVVIPISTVLAAATRIVITVTSMQQMLVGLTILLLIIQ